MKRIEAIHRGPAEQIASAPPSFFQLAVWLLWPSTLFRFCSLSGFSAARSSSRLFPEEKGSDKACVRHLFRTKQQGNVYLMNTEN